MSPLKIYFAGSIRGGRQDAAFYREIINILRTKGEVLTEHIGHNGLSPDGETGMSDYKIYQRDTAWLASSDIIVAEVTSPSLGVGFEVSMAVGLGKPVLCLYRPRPGTRLSAMIGGCPEVNVIEYLNPEDLIGKLDSFFGSFLRKAE
jgi:nucleoside 2-deoxyribosyltransferase